MNEDGVSSLDKAAITRAVDAVCNRMGPSLTAITIHHDGTARQHGMGTLFDIGGRKFLITAAHVIAPALHLKAELSIFDFALPNEPVNAVPLLWTGRHFEDPVDVAVLELRPETIALIPKRRFLSFAFTNIDPVQGGVFGVFGYPSENAIPLPDGKGHFLEPFSYVTQLYRGDTDIFENKVDPEIHVMFRRDWDSLVDRDGGQVSMDRNLKGISGCCIWQICPFGKPFDQCTEKDIGVVGVQTGVSKNAIRATRWRAISSLLWRAYPELQPHLILNKQGSEDIERSR